MIARPLNDRECLGAITQEVRALVESRDPQLVAVAQEHGSPRALVSWIRSLPQRDDTGMPCDGPKVETCRPPQRLRIPAEDPNCVERAALYLAAAELLDPGPLRRLATVDTPSGLHTFPTENGEPVILDPAQSRNALRAGLFRARRARNGNGPIALTPAEAIDWIAEIANEPAGRFANGRRRVRNGHRALRGVLVGRPLCIADARDVALLLTLAHREAKHFGRPGRCIVQTTTRAVDRLDRIAARGWMDGASARNSAELRIGNLRIRPDVPLLGSLGRIGGRVGYQVGVEALRAKLDALGIGAPVLSSIERELNREGLSLGALARPAPMIGTFGALTPEALAGRWLAKKL